MHHAYCYTGNNRAAIRAQLFKVFEKELHFDVNANPDFYHIEADTFGIDESRSVKEIHGNRAVNKENRRVFLIEANAITHEAQNALLKVLEEPQEGTYFFITIPSVEILLPTLRSRLQIIHANKSGENVAEKKKAKDFLKMSVGEKIAFADEMAGDIADEKILKQEAIHFMNELEFALVEEKGVKGAKEKLKAVMKAREYMKDRAPSMKQLLEYVALSV